MDKKLIIANWKSHKNINDSESFINSLAQNINRIDTSNKEIVLSPSFQILNVTRDMINKFNLPVFLCAQDVSPYPEGAYTGEVNASQVKELCEWVIIGHSERREYFNEDDDLLSKKVNEAKKARLNIIYCVQNADQKIPNNIEVVAYEPIEAIGTGKADEPLHIEEVFEKINHKFKGKILYGGSVTRENVRDFIYIKRCSGLLVGGASLDADSFINLLKQW